MASDGKAKANTYINTAKNALTGKRAVVKANYNAVYAPDPTISNKMEVKN